MPMQSRKKRTDKLYEKTIQIGFDDNGTPKRIHIYGRTLKELEQKYEETKSELRERSYSKRRAVDTVASYSINWIKRKESRAKNTYNMYYNIIYKHIIPDIGELKFKELRNTNIQNMIADRSEHFRTCQQLIMVLRQITRAAVLDKLMSPQDIELLFTDISLPTRKKTEKRPLYDIEKQALKEADLTERERAFTYVIYGCGLRRGEALALTKSDINFIDNTITVNKSLAFDGNNSYIKEPKTENSYRTVTMPDFLNSFLKQYISRLDDATLITKQNGEQITKSGYNKMWQSIIKKMNIAAGGNDNLQIIQGLTAHLFRHNYCTMLCYQSYKTKHLSIKMIAALMGDTEKMVQEVYSHIIEDMEDVTGSVNQALKL